VSRRPPPVRGERMGLAVSRMAPGGRMWSESPIPRTAIRKVRAAGATAPPPPGWGTCIDLVTDPDGHTFRPASGTFGAPALNYYFSITLKLGATVPSTYLRYDLHTAAGLNRVYTVTASDVGQPLAAGATIVVYDQEMWDPPPAWTMLRTAAGTTGTTWVPASGVVFCHSPAPPPPAAALAERRRVMP
jgi:hypothetical protein